jgi:hypothetical protein
MTAMGRSSGHPEFIFSVVILTLLYINSEVVIPAKAGIQFRNNGFPRVKHGAGFVKPGMTNKGKEFLSHYTGSRFWFWIYGLTRFPWTETFQSQRGRIGQRSCLYPYKNGMDNS